MLGAEDPGARLEDLLQDVAPTRKVTLLQEDVGEVAQGNERVGVRWAGGPGVRLEDLLEELLCAPEVALLIEGVGQIVLGSERIGLLGAVRTRG